jgi:hypothetical protein
VPEPEVFDVVHGLVEEVGDVGVVECVDDRPSATLADDEAEVTENAELVRDGGRLHFNDLREVVDGGR